MLKNWIAGNVPLVFFGSDDFGQYWRRSFLYYRMLEAIMNVLFYFPSRMFAVNLHQVKRAYIQAEGARGVSDNMILSTSTFQDPE